MAESAVIQAVREKRDELVATKEQRIDEYRKSLNIEESDKLVKAASQNLHSLEAKQAEKLPKWNQAIKELEEKLEEIKLNIRSNNAAKADLEEKIGKARERLDHAVASHASVPGLIDLFAAHLERSITDLTDFLREVNEKARLEKGEFEADISGTLERAEGGRQEKRDLEESSPNTDRKRNGSAKASHSSRMDADDDDSADAARPKIALLELLIDKIAAIKTTALGTHFKDPVVKLWPQFTTSYAEKIAKPVDLSLIEAKLRANTYISVAQIKVDVKLIYDNCARFNGTDHELSIIAQTIVDQIWDVFPMMQDSQTRSGVVFKGE